MQGLRIAVSIGVILGLAGCATIKEDHFMTAVSTSGSRCPTCGANDAEVNFLRLQVRGWAMGSSARYVAGYYDERAIDLFFNEIKTVAGSPGSIAPLFVDNQTNPGTTDNLTPLSPPDDHGAFMMIFSTNATAVANAIGNFAEGNAVADAVTNLLNKDDIERSREIDARSSTMVGRATGTRAEIDALFQRITDKANNNQDVEADFIRVLNALARPLGARRQFDTISEAAAWFEARRSSMQGVTP